MGYWDEEVGHLAPRLESRSPRARLKIAAEALTWTVGALDSPIADPEAAGYIADGIERVEAAVRLDLAVPQGADDMAARYPRLFEDSWEPGVANFLTATLLCFSRRRPELPARTVMAQLLELYEGVLFRAVSAGITPEIERSTPQTVEVVAFQKRLLDRAVGEAALRD